MSSTVNQTLKIVIFSTSLFANAALADQLKLNNGDILSGEILKKDSKVVKLKTSYAGNISVAWKDIASISTDKPNQIMLADDSIVNGTIQPSESGKGTLKITGLEAKNDIPLTQIKYINPTPEQSGIGVAWSGYIDLSGATSRGNTENSAYRLSGESVARTKQNRFTIGGQANRADNNGVESEFNNRAYMQYDHFVSEKWYVYANGALENDRFRDIKLRSRIGSGMGYSFYNTQDIKLDIETGLTYVNTDFYEAVDENNPNARWALNYKNRLFDTAIETFHRHEILLGIDNTDDLLIFTQTGFRFPFTQHINASTQLNVDYQKTPAVGRKSTDTTLLFGVGYGW